MMFTAITILNDTSMTWLLGIAVIVLVIALGIRIGFLYDYQEYEEEDGVTYEQELLVNLGLEVHGVMGTLGSGEPLVCHFENCIMCAYAVGNFLFRFYIFDRKLEYTISDFLTGRTISCALKLKKGVIDYAFLGENMRADFNQLYDKEAELGELLDKASDACENKELTDAKLIDSLFTLAKEAAARHDDVLAVAILTGLFRYAPVEDFLNAKDNKGGEETDGNQAT